MTKIHDITVTISNDLPVWPGDPRVSLERFSKIEDGEDANVSRLSMSAHSGTHMDAPYHFLPQGKTIDALPLEVLIGQAQVVQVPETADVINRAVLMKAGIKAGMERVLFKTRNAHFWPGVDFHKDFVSVDVEGAKTLVEMKIRMVGIDYLSISPFHNSRPTHEILLGNEIIVLEGCDLSGVEPGFYALFALPLKLGGGDGAPVRAVLLEG